MKINQKKKLPSSISTISAILAKKPVKGGIPPSDKKTKHNT
jgi:hypothetical protein